MHYLLLKDLHVYAVYTSLALFCLRGLAMLADAQWHRRGAWRVLPHMVDTVLLLAGIGLMLTVAQYPFVHDWLTVKLLALVTYIVLGSVALRYGPSKRIRVGALAAALVVFAYMLGVAYWRSPRSWTVLLG